MYHIDLRTAFADAFSDLVSTDNALSDDQERYYAGFHISYWPFAVKDFRTPVVFDSAVFYDDLWFHAVHFQQGVRFDFARFLSPIRVSDCRFGERASFSAATFGDELAVRDTEFGKVSFGGAKFCGSTSFAQSYFAQGIWCEDARFQGDCSFSACRFRGRSSFAISVVGRRLIFQQAYPYKGETDSFGELADFSGIIFEERGHLAFIEMDLLGVSFANTNLEHASFVGVRWPKTRVALRTRRYLSDETYRGADIAELAENYRQLVISHEKKRDFVAAEDFHIGEMEAQRRLLGAGVKNPTLRRIREWVNSYALYRLLTFYGTSYWWAFSALLVFVAAFASAFLLAGFQPAKESVGAFRGPIEYDLTADPAHRWMTWPQLLRDFGQAILFVLSILTFQRDRFYEPTGDWGRLILFVAVLILPAQAALVLLAIRRRFKR